MIGWVDRCNKEAHYNAATALEVGLEVPEYKFLRGMTSSEIEDILHNPQYELIGDTGMVMEKIHGPDVTFHAFLKDRELSLETISINDGRLLTGGQGPDVGDAATTIFCGTNETMQGVIRRLGEMALSHEKEYTGFINVSVVFKNNIPYYRNIMFGTTYKFVSNILQLYDSDLEVLFAGGNQDRKMGVPGYGVSLRVWAWPYEIQRNQALIQNPEGSIFQWDGESYYLTGRGNRIKDAWKELYAAIPPVDGMCYRTDADVKARRIYNEIMRCQYVNRLQGHNIHSADSSPVPVRDGGGVLPDAGEDHGKDENGSQVEG